MEQNANPFAMAQAAWPSPSDPPSNLPCAAETGSADHRRQLSLPGASLDAGAELDRREDAPARRPFRPDESDFSPPLEA
jgi:hypothetical protein